MEDTNHVLFECPIYYTHILKQMQVINNYSTIDVLLHGDPHLNLQTNQTIFVSALDYINIYKSLTELSLSTIVYWHCIFFANERSKNNVPHLSHYACLPVSGTNIKNNNLERAIINNYIIRVFFFFYS